MEIVFIKADSVDLPKIDCFMIANFFASNPDFSSAEFRNVKTSLSSKIIIIILPTQILKHQPDFKVPDILQFSMHYLSIKHKKESDCGTFLTKFIDVFSHENINLVESLIRAQRKTQAWHELRYYLYIEYIIVF